MVFRSQPSSLAITFVLTSFLVACGGSEPDSKLVSTVDPVIPKNTLTGVALDGYLKDARVCIDLNRNLYCDSHDGESVLTGASGEYTLAVTDINLSRYSVIVEAIPNQTIDMDHPHKKIDKAFVLSAPATQAALVTPFTSLISTIAEQRGTNFETAKQVLAQLLAIDADILMSDYLAGQERTDKELHLLAQGLTKIMQAGEQASVEKGIGRIIARQGTRAKMVLLDLSGLKSRTDKLVGTNNPQAMDEIVREHVADVLLSPNEILNNRVVIIPKAPKSGVVNDESDTFSWSWVGHFTHINDYEYSLDSGKTWQAASAMPLYVGLDAYGVGEIQVRIRADENLGRQAGLPVLSDKVFTRVLTPSAPASLIINDATNSFDWQLVPEHTDYASYEYSLNRGVNWQPITAKPQLVEDLAIAAGAVQLRLIAGASLNSPAGHIISSMSPFTVTPARPTAPTVLTVNDDHDSFSWQPLAAFPLVADYEIYLDASWRQASSNPEFVGNREYPANTIKIRVPANASNGMPAGISAVITQGFTQELGKPVAALNGVVDDIADSFDWAYVPGFESAAHYEISTDAGQTWGGVNTKPAVIDDGEFAIGQVCVRVMANAVGNHVTGSILCSEAAFTLKPVTPSAPTQPVSDDALDTLGWQWTSGFEQVTAYEIKTPAQDWKTANANPYQLLLDNVYQAGEVQVRVKGDALTGRDPGLPLVNVLGYTVKPSQPDAPINPLQDDNLNSFDWQTVMEFPRPSDYEFSVNGGTSWLLVSEKPLLLGDVSLAAGQVQVRVKANALNGMPAGKALVSTADFIAGVQAEAPSNPQIVNVSGGTITNGLSWNWVPGFSQASHYEYSQDAGLSWTGVSSNPQHMGPQAYAKDQLQIRVRGNAKTGEVNPPGKTMDATGASGDFVAMEFVPMLSVGKVVTISESYNGSNQYRFDTNQVCWAQFDANGEGEPSYWENLRSYIDRAELVDELAAINLNSVCGLSGWDAAPESLVMASTGISSSGSRKPVNMSKGNGSFWAKSGSDYVVYNSGAITTPGTMGSQYYPYWKMAQTSEVMAQLLVISSDAVTRVNSLETREISLNASLLTEMAKAAPVLNDVEKIQLDIQALNVEAMALTTELDEAYVAYGLYVDLIIKNRPTTTSANLAELQSNLAELQAQKTASSLLLNRTQASIKALNALNYLLVLATNLHDVTDKVNSIAGDNGQVLHGAALELYQAIHQLQLSLKDFHVIHMELTQAVDSGGLSDAINTELNILLARLNSLESGADVTWAQTTAMQALTRAKSEGYTVPVADAVIGTHFSKLDINGDYLPSNTSFAQGWRCVSDNRFANYSRIWTLLGDGLPGGLDNLPFDDGTNTESNVMGTSGLLQRRNDANYCGHSDWQVPGLTQTETLATSGSSYSRTIDTSVFPHHLALTDEYDKYSGGKRFFYWLSKAHASDGAKQQAFTFKTANNYGSSKDFFDKSVAELDGKIFISRFVSEISPYELIDMNGSVTLVLADAKCARDKTSGNYWQLFDDKGGARFKKFNDLAGILDEVNTASLCGLTTWAIPSFAEVNTLYPYDKSVFINNEVSANYNKLACYVSSDESSLGYSGKRKRCLKLDGSETYVTYEGGYNTISSLYRLRGK
ncbi:hypothetical protein [Shewanella violacea]|uniref:BNR repeat protein n=1 Tax=Shewanella violacea (strain JCM 10179 / CIP 106290 / LMG 19151 / DSS12) TaxID=637905 RepID=D4ZHB8_SHEVD|nr:hypothetical protein [Shewanella violacea]BAJ01067.1 BNR repeat protein [Shewanella violacea DSS12]